MTMTRAALIIIADNGGGLTLQIVDPAGRQYQHTYDNPAHCARDIRDFLADGTTEDWDGNEADDEEGVSQWLEPSDEDVRNGGYRVLSLADLDPESGWRNIRELARALQEAD
jgi:hypothetical protein